MSSKPIHVSYITQVPGPYRERMHELIAENRDFEYDVIYCAKLEPNRKWKLDYGVYTKYFLAENATTYRHNNPNVWKLLNKLKPDVIIISAFKPTMLYSVAWCIINRKKIIVYNDGTYISEAEYSKVQKMIRKFVFKFTDAFLAPGKGTIDLYKSYGIASEKIFKSCLCVDNTQFSYQNMASREFHIMFSGQIIERKMPLFFTAVAKQLKKLIPELKVLILGDGELREKMLEDLRDADIAYEFPGFLDQSTLPAYYAKAKLFLFPTLNDPWGIVVNEACASGTPVITCSNAGVAEDLILDGENGYILPLDVDEWTKHISKLLTDNELLEKFSQNAIELVKPFTHKQAADGIIDSVNFALSKKTSGN